MLTPVPMLRVELLALDRDLVALSERLGAMAVLHPADVRELDPRVEVAAWTDVQDLAARYGDTGRRLDRAVDFLGLQGGDRIEEILIGPEEVLLRAGELLRQVEPGVRGLAARLHDLDTRRQGLEAIQGQLEALSHIDVDLAELRSLRFLHLVSGLLPAENLRRLHDSLRDVPHALAPVQRFGDRVLLFAFSRREEAAALDRALQSAYLERVQLPTELTGTPAQALAGLREQRTELEREAQEIRREREAFGQQWGPALRRMQRQLDANARVVELWSRTGRTERTRLLAGWLPEAIRERFVGEVAAATHGRSILAMAPPSPTGDGIAIAPTALANPPPLRPFEGLTRTYGTPDYWDLDPTPLAAALFVLMFGLMFGDLGQGAVLAAVGAALARGWIVGGQRAFGAILFGCGVSAMVAGLLYGSVFGSEEVIPALWLRPMERPLFLIGLAVGLGVVVLSIGLVFGAVSAWRRRDLASLYLGQSGLAGLWLYWGLVASALLAVLAPGYLSPGVLGLLIGVPLALIFLHGPIARALGWASHGEDGTYYVQAGVEAFDLLVRLTSNTVSFLRLGAFALAHVGLGLTVFALAELVHELPAASLVVLVAGNALILTLEALIVGIQALRLEYYEFFTKFLHGGGVAYHPFTLRRRDGNSG